MKAPEEVVLPKPGQLWKRRRSTLLWSHTMWPVVIGANDQMLQKEKPVIVEGDDIVMIVGVTHTHVKRKLNVVRIEVLVGGRLCVRHYEHANNWTMFFEKVS